MKHIVSLLLIILTVGLLATGCENEDSSAVDRQVGDYFPITVGSQWEYQGEGNEYASFTREVLFEEGNKAQFKEDNGGTVSASVYELSDAEITRVFNQGESYEPTNFLAEEPNDNLIILKAPLEVGTKWEGTQGSREIVDVDATAETPAGAFSKCIDVKIVGEDSEIHEYFAPGVGMVLRTFQAADTTVTSSLLTYDIPSE